MMGLLVAAPVFAVDSASGAGPAAVGPKRYFVLLHSPGPHWDHTKPFQDQPGIDLHVGYMQGFLNQGKLVQGGPFLDDSGGMMVFDIGSIEAAKQIAADDPAVKAGLLTVEVKPWLVALSRVSKQE